MRNLLKGYGHTIAAAGLITAVAVTAVCADDGKATYDKNCTPCHGVAGKGDGVAAAMLKPPPPEFATALKSMSDTDIAKVIKEGGKAVGKAPTMPPFGSRLSDDQIKDVVDYIKGLK